MPVLLVGMLAMLLCGCRESARPDFALKSETANEQAVESDLQTAGAASDVMEVHFIDVGQSDSTLIVNGEHAMLIDAGENDKGTMVQDYLKEQGVESLDYLVLTHTDSDHIGGADVIITKLDVDTVFMGDYEKDNKTYQDVMDALEDRGLEWSTPSVGSVYQLGDAGFTVIAPNEVYEECNNTSIGLLVEKGEIGFLFTGDAYSEVEQDIVRNSKEMEFSIEAEVYHVGHHGSASSSSTVFLEAVQPVYGVISCGADNPYGYPHVEPLDALRERGIQVLRTDEQGSIIATTDGTSITWSHTPSETWKRGSLAEAEENTWEAEQVGEVTFICNINTGRFHLPDCPSVKDMAGKNRRATNEAREALISQGYTACNQCRP